MRRFFLVFSLLLALIDSRSQDTAEYKLMLSVPIIDLPQNIDLPYSFPSMAQTMAVSSDFYELGFRGVELLSNKILDPNTSKGRRMGNEVMKFGLGYAFSKYGSELPIPLGVWGHEEYHRVILGLNGINSKNGNWLANRWDGTVYGVSDTALSQLKSANPKALLYSYVSSVQYEIQLNQNTIINQFLYNRSYNKTPLLLYNAYYVYNYFRFACSPSSDSVKVLAPPHESAISSERDFAGSDLDAWAYDMFSPQSPYDNRDSFPGGMGVNRRIGFSDLSQEGQDFLLKQKKLSLLNFVSPALFFVNSIGLSPDFSFNFFMQYVPTHFGNDVALYIPMKIKGNRFMCHFHNYSASNLRGFGVGAAMYNWKIGNRLWNDIGLTIGSQPNAYWNNGKDAFAILDLGSRYQIKERFSLYTALTAKTRAWELGDPYINSNLSVQLGLKYNIQ